MFAATGLNRPSRGAFKNAVALLIALFQNAAVIPLCPFIRDRPSASKAPGEGGMVGHPCSTGSFCKGPFAGGGSFCGLGTGFIGDFLIPERQEP